MPGAPPKPHAVDLEPAAAYLRARFQPAAIWLFGSWASGRATPHSDVDLAMLARGAAVRDLLDARVDLADLLGAPVDLVELASASPVVGMKVLSEGRLLACDNGTATAAWSCRIPSMYYDVQRVNAPVLRAFLARRGSHGS